VRVEVAEDRKGAVEVFCEDQGVGVAGCVDAGFGEGEDGLGDWGGGGGFVLTEFDEEVQEGWAGC